MGAQTILLSTIPVKLAGTPENTVKQNKNLRLYSDAISKTASKRKKRFINLFTPVSQHKAAVYSYNGLHLNEEGYYFLSQLLERGVGWPSRGAKVLEIASGNDNKASYSLEEHILTRTIPTH